MGLGALIGGLRRKGGWVFVVPARPRSLLGLRPPRLAGPPLGRFAPPVRPGAGRSGPPSAGLALAWPVAALGGAAVAFGALAWGCCCAGGLVPVRLCLSLSAPPVAR